MAKSFLEDPHSAANRALGNEVQRTARKAFRGSAGFGEIALAFGGLIAAQFLTDKLAACLKKKKKEE